MAEQQNGYPVLGANAGFCDNGGRFGFLLNTKHKLPFLNICRYKQI